MITAKDLENLIETIYRQVESELGITRWQFVRIAGHGRGNANQIGKNPTLKTIINLLETRDKLFAKNHLTRVINNDIMDA